MLTIWWVSVVGESVITSWQNPCNSISTSQQDRGQLDSSHLNSGKEYLPGNDKCALGQLHNKTSLIFDIYFEMSHKFIKNTVYVRMLNVGLPTYSFSVQLFG